MAIQDAPSSHVKYDVFLSFRGGTRRSFTDHLYRKLRDCGVDTFRDVENLGVGHEIRPYLLESIEKSRMSIAVLCEDYASSPWCLDELARIIECHEKKGMHVLAIIYKVEPSDVWELKHSYEAAMIKYEKSKRYEEDRVEAWRSALSKVRNLEKEHCRDDTYEPEFIKKIVRDTSAKLPPVPFQSKHVVGLDARYEQVKPLLNIELDDKVCMLEIYGPGGIGKTTFARCLYDKIKHLFEGKCFLANVREKSTESHQGLEHLQKALLSSLGEGTETKLGSTFKGGYQIKSRLGRKRVLIVLDDVDSVKQLESLAGGGHWFGPGSRIIITTRDTSVLHKHVMDGVIIEKYKMDELNDRDSLELFCWYAFKEREPPVKLSNVSSRATSFAKGFPLALKVIGSNLKGIERPEEWEAELEKYRDAPNDEILGVLEISYNSLFDLDQKTFLDVACFFKGERWEYVKRVLKACDFYPILRVFVSKSLITLDDNDCLEMHDLIQDMGKEIVKKESQLLGSRSRLWSHTDILQVLKQDLGSDSIEGIMLHPPQHEEVNHWTNTAFEKMKNLRILIVRNTHFATGPSYLPNSLRLLNWKGYPSESFSTDFYPRRIVDFKLPHSRLTLERSFQKFEDLTFINFSHCQCITRVPNLSEAKNLRVLTLDRCHKLVTFDESVGSMQNLVYLSASECSMLESFVPRMDLPSLEVLSFNCCKILKQFPEVMKKMDKPLRIYLVDTAIEEFPETIDNLSGLEHVDISFCRRLKNLSSSFFLLPKLVTLIIEGCTRLGESFKGFKERHSTANHCPNFRTLDFSEACLSNEALHPILQKFPRLENLIISRNEFTSLPGSIIGSSNIKSLDVSYCMNLRDIPELPSSIQKVDALHCSSLTSEASTMLWKVLQETERLQVVMPKTKIPNWFDCVCNKDIPLFWARRKFPVVALAFVFGGVMGEAIEGLKIDTDDPESVEHMHLPDSYLVGLTLFIDGQEISREDYNYFTVGEDHVLLCDLRALFSVKEWQGLDGCLGDEWKAIQVQCETELSLSQWGVYVYKLEANMGDIFQLPNPNSSEEHMPSSHLVPKINRQRFQQRIRLLTENIYPREIRGEFLPLLDSDENPYMSAAVLLTSKRNAKAKIRGGASALAYGASIKQEHEESAWEVGFIMDLVKEAVPKHVIDSSPDAMNATLEVLEKSTNCLLELRGGSGAGILDIFMPIILEEYRVDEAPSRRYWGRLEIKGGDPTLKAVWRRRQLEWSSGRNVKRMDIVLLKSQQPSTEEASSSSHGEEEYNDPVLEELMSRIEQDAMNLNESYGKLKASIVLTDQDQVLSKEYLLECLILIVLENSERISGPETLGSYFVKTPYGSLRGEHDAQCSAQKQVKLMAEHDTLSTTQHRQRQELRVKHDAQRSSLKPIKLMTEHDALRARQKLMVKNKAHTTKDKVIESGGKNIEVAVMTKEHGLRQLEEAEIVAEIEAEKAAAEAAKKSPSKET